MACLQWERIYINRHQKLGNNAYICPVCGGRQTGKIGMANYFCHACLIEFNGKNEAFRITEDGLLLAEEVRRDAR